MPNSGELAVVLGGAARVVRAGAESISESVASKGAADTAQSKLLREALDVGIETAKRFEKMTGMVDVRKEVNRSVLEQPVLVGEYFSPVPKIIPIDIHQSPILDQMNLRWDRSHYSIARDPITIGKVTDLTQFGKPGAPALQEFPIKLPNTDFRVPVELKQFEPTIQNIIDFEKTINPNFNDTIAYLRVDQRPVFAGATQRVSGLHFDGVQGINRMYKDKLPPHREYVVSDNPDVTTSFVRQGFDFSNTDERVFNLNALAQQEAKPENMRQGEAGTIYMMDAYLLHGATPALRDGTRTFFSIGFAPSEAKYDRLGNSINPFFNDQPGYPWRQYDRSVPQWLLTERTFDQTKVAEAAARTTASRAYESVFDIKDKVVDATISDLQRLSSIKESGARVTENDLKWTDDQHGKDSTYQKILANKNDFAPVFEEFHDAYVSSKKEIGEL